MNVAEAESVLFANVTDLVWEIPGHLTRRELMYVGESPGSFSPPHTYY